ncbi:MAG: GatB/YqeY domain-containing protein [Candidatus Glassbacteria bacterium]|nr:GatB/YqeY domain-containing protein [Candidatus Glassbacteria bacterium]
MPVEQQLLDDLKRAMKARDELTTGVLRMLKSQLMNEKTKKGGRKELTEETVVQVFATYAKQLRDAKEQFENGGRTDLADQHARELEIVERYLPAQADEDEIREVIGQVVEDLAAEGPEHMGRVMGAVMLELQGRVDGKVVSAMVRERLQQG